MVRASHTLCGSTARAVSFADRSDRERARAVSAGAAAGRARCRTGAAGARRRRGRPARIRRPRARRTGFDADADRGRRDPGRARRAAPGEHGGAGGAAHPRIRAAPQATLAEPAAEWGAGAPECAPVPPPEEPIPELEVPEHPAAPAPAQRSSRPPDLAAAEPEDLELPLDPLANIRDDVDEQVLPMFLEEAAELYPQAGAQVRAWRRAPGDAGQRAAAAPDAAHLQGQCAHGRRDAPGRARAPDGIAAVDRRRARAGHVGAVRGAGRGPRPHRLRARRAARAARPTSRCRGPDPTAAVAPPSERRRRRCRCSRRPPATVPRRGDRRSLPRRAAARRRGPGAAEVESRRPRDAARARRHHRPARQRGRRSGDHADAQIEGELRALKANLLELNGSVIRLRAQVREIEIQAESQIQSRLAAGGRGRGRLRSARVRPLHALPGSRALAGRGGQRRIDRPAVAAQEPRRADAALVAQGAACRATCSSSCSRSGPCRSAACRSGCTGSCAAPPRSSASARTSRSAARRSSSTASVLEKLAGPLEHLLRNARRPRHRAARRAGKAGKSETGEITLTVRQVGNEIAIELADDGAGLDLGRVRAQAVAQGMVAADALPTEAQLDRLHVPAGVHDGDARHAGLGPRHRHGRRPLGDRRAGRPRRGHDARGRGTTFVLYLPLTLAVAQAVLVRARRKAVGAAGGDGRAGPARGPTRCVSCTSRTASSGRA